MTDGRARLGLLLGFLAFASWGLLSPLGKIMLEDFHPLTLNATRFTLATALFLVAAGPTAVRESFRLMTHGDIAWVNLLANVSLTLFLYSLQRLDATYATLGFYTAPLWTAAIAAALLGERVGRAFVPAVVGLLAGGYLALFGWSSPSGTLDGAGLAMAVGSAVVWGLYSVQLRRHAPDIPLKPLMGASFLWGTLYYWALALHVEPPLDVATVPQAAWGWMALYVLVPTLASFILFNAALQRAGAAAVTMMVGAELGFTALFAWLLLGDGFDAAQLAGLVVVLVAVTAYLWTQRAPVDAATAH